MTETFTRWSRQDKRALAGFRTPAYHCVLAWIRPQAGRSEYSLRNLDGLALNEVLFLSLAPLRAASAQGASLTRVSLCADRGFPRLESFEDRCQRWFEGLTELVPFLRGLQMLLFGLPGEHVERMYKELQQRPRTSLDEFST